MADNIVRVKFRADGIKEVRDAIRGISTEVGRQARTQTSAARTERVKQANDTKRIAQDEVRAKRRLDASYLREAQRAYREQTAEARRQARERERAERASHAAATRAARQAAREQSAAARKAAQEAATTQRTQERALLRRNRLVGAGIIGGAVAGVASAGAKASELSQAYGMRSQAELLSAGIRVRQESIRLGAQAGIDPNQIANKVGAVSAKYGLEQEDMVSALGGAQAQFNNAKAVLANLDTLGQIAHATGAAMSDVIGTSSEMQRQFELSDESAKQMAYAMADIAKRGSVDFAEVAQQFRDTFGQYQRATGVGGERGAMQAIGIAQVLGEGGLKANKSATVLEGMMRAINNPEVRGRLADQGVVVAGGKRNKGKLLPIEEIMQNIAASEVGKDSGLAQQVFGEQTAAQGFGIVSSVIAKNPGMFQSYMSGDAKAGQKYIAGLSNALLADPTGQASTARAKQLTDFMNSGGTEKFASALNSTVLPLERLKAEYPAMTAALTVAKDAVLGLAAASTLASMVTKGQGVAGAVGAAATGAAGLGGAGVAAAGAGAAGAAAGAGLLTMVGGGLVAAAGGYYLGSQLIDATGQRKNVEESLYNLTGGDGTDMKRTTERGLGTKGKPLVVQLDAASAQALANAAAKVPNETRRQPGGPRGR